MRPGARAILQSHALWYAYDPAANLVRIAPKTQLDAEDALSWDTLPDGKTIDLDFKDAPLRDVIQIVASAAGSHVNVVLPDTVEGRVTMSVKGAPWDRVLQAALASHR